VEDISICEQQEFVEIIAVKYVSLVVIVIDVFDGFCTGLPSCVTWHGLTVLVLVYRVVSLGVV